ncbi:MAG: acyl-CoA thioesterase [Bacteroidota bacterium]|nr:acyl-CoA thioesterase [Bacteroidota bacterium]MDP4237442.1 acyl-CoA thioesterase [Bacteroidota bacterium]
MPAKKTKRVRESQVEMTELVLPNDTNQLGNLLGGRLMHWMDICAAMAAGKHSGRVCVTASVDEINFLGPVKLGQVIHIRASVNRAFHTSMEVGVNVVVEDIHTGYSRHVNTGYLTFVALDETGRGVQVPEIVPVSSEEKRRFEGAFTRRNARLKRRKLIEANEEARLRTESKKKKKVG